MRRKTEGDGWRSASSPREVRRGSAPMLAQCRHAQGTRCVAYYVAYPFGLGGATRSLMELVLNLPELIRPLLLIAAEGPVAAFCRQHGIPHEVIEPPESLLEFGKAALRWTWRRRSLVAARDLAPYTARLMACLVRHRVQLLHVNDARGALLAAPAAKLLRLPVVGHLRGRMPFGGVYPAAFERLCDRIITVCDGIQSSLGPRGRERAVTVYNGTRDLSLTVPALGPGDYPWLQQRRAEGELILGCFATITPFKGHHHLLDALARLRQRGERVPLTLCLGDTPDEEYLDFLEDKKRTLGLAEVTFAGFQREPLPLYRLCDLTVLPSVEAEQLRVGASVRQVSGNEGFPRTHLEAMAMGVAVVGTRIGGVAEQVLDEQTGLLVPPGDPEALSVALSRLLTSAETRSRFAMAGRERVQRLFSTEAYVRGVCEVYRGLGW